MRWILLMVALTSMNAMAERQLSVHLSGAYTELDGIVPLDGRLDPPPIDSPFLPEPFEPEPVPISGDVPFQSEGRTWEVLLNYRFASRFQIQGGYVDLGSFTSEKIGGPIFAAPVPNPGPFNPFPAPPPGGFTRAPLPPGGLFASPISFTQSVYNLGAAAWTLGAKADYPIIGKALVYARAGILRASFEASDTFGDIIDVEDPSDENGWYWGAGLQYPLHNRVLIGGGFAQYDLSLQRFDSWQLSLELVLF